MASQSAATVATEILNVLLGDINYSERKEEYYPSHTACMIETSSNMPVNIPVKCNMDSKKEQISTCDGESNLIKNIEIKQGTSMISEMVSNKQKTSHNCDETENGITIAIEPSISDTLENRSKHVSFASPLTKCEEYSLNDEETESTASTQELEQDGNASFDYSEANEQISPDDSAIIRSAIVEGDKHLSAIKISSEKPNVTNKEQIEHKIQDICVAYTHKHVIETETVDRNNCDINSKILRKFDYDKVDLDTGIQSEITSPVPQTNADIIFKIKGTEEFIGFAQIPDYGTVFESRTGSDPLSTKNCDSNIPSHSGHSADELKLIVSAPDAEHSISVTKIEHDLNSCPIDAESNINSIAEKPGLENISKFVTADSDPRFPIPAVNNSENSVTSSDDFDRIYSTNLECFSKSTGAEENLSDIQISKSIENADEIKNIGIENISLNTDTEPKCSIGGIGPIQKFDKINSSNEDCVIHTENGSKCTVNDQHSFILTSTFDKVHTHSNGEKVVCDNLYQLDQKPVSEETNCILTPILTNIFKTSGDTSSTDTHRVSMYNVQKEEGNDMNHSRKTSKLLPLSSESSIERKAQWFLECKESVDSLKSIDALSVVNATSNDEDDKFKGNTCNASSSTMHSHQIITKELAKPDVINEIPIKADTSISTEAVVANNVNSFSTLLIELNELKQMNIGNNNSETKYCLPSCSNNSNIIQEIETIDNGNIEKGTSVNFPSSSEEYKGDGFQKVEIDSSQEEKLQFISASQLYNSQCSEGEIMCENILTQNLDQSLEDMCPSDMSLSLKRKENTLFEELPLKKAKFSMKGYADEQMVPDLDPREMNEMETDQSTEVCNPSNQTESTLNVYTCDLDLRNNEGILLCHSVDEFNHVTSQEKKCEEDRLELENAGCYESSYKWKSKSISCSPQSIIPEIELNSTNKKESSGCFDPGTAIFTPPPLCKRTRRLGLSRNQKVKKALHPSFRKPES